MKALWRPVATMEALSREQGAAAGFFVVFLYALVGLISTGISLFAGTGQLQPRNLPPGISPDQIEQLALAGKITGVLIAALLPFLYWLILSLVMQLVTSFFGGEGALGGMFATMGAAHAPFVIQALLGIPLALLQVALPEGSPVITVAGVVGFVLFAGFLVWHIALVVIGASRARAIGYGQSGGSCAISCAGCVGLPVLLFVALAIVLAAAGGGGQF